MSNDLRLKNALRGPLNIVSSISMRICVESDTFREHIGSTSLRVTRFLKSANNASNNQK